MCKTIALSALKNGYCRAQILQGPFFEMIPYQKDRQNRLPFFYRNNTQKRDGIVPNIVPHIVPHIVPTELQKPLFCAAVGKEKDGTFFAPQKNIRQNPATNTASSIDI